MKPATSLPLFLVGLAGTSAMVAVHPPLSFKSAAGALEQSLMPSNFRVGLLTDTERTVYAENDAAANEVLLRVPWNLIVTPQRGMDTPLGRVAATMAGTSTSDFLCCWLATAALNQKKKKAAALTKDDLFFCSLPSISELSHIPAFWSASDLNFLTGSPLRMVKSIPICR